MMSNFIRIGGKRIYPLPLISILQTDGSFSRGGKAACAFLLKNSVGDQVLSRKIDLSKIRSSTEAEWASVARSLESALELGQECIGIENDCLGVIAGLLPGEGTLKHAYAREYRREILHLANATAWTGIRWIPRKLNRADDLFRMS